MNTSDSRQVAILASIVLLLLVSCSAGSSRANAQAIFDNYVTAIHEGDQSTVDSLESQMRSDAKDMDPVIEKSLSSPDPDKRKAACYAVHITMDPNACEALLRLAQNESDPAVKLSAIQGLGLARVTSAIPFLKSQVNLPFDQSSFVSLCSLYKINSEAAVAAFQSRLSGIAGPMDQHGCLCVISMLELIQKSDPKGNSTFVLSVLNRLKSCSSEQHYSQLREDAVAKRPPSHLPAGISS